MKKKILIISFLIFIILTGCLNTCHAKLTTISENVFINNFSKNLDNYLIQSPTDKEDNKIKVFDTNNNHLSTIEYNLDTLTFYIDIVFENTDDTLSFLLKNELFNILSSEIYATLSNMNAISYSDSYSYISDTISSASIFEYSSSESDKIVYKDKIVPISDFKDYAVSIAKDYYSTNRTDSDKSSLNTFNLTRKVKKSTKTNCTVTGTLTVNHNYLTYNYYLNEPENITTNNADHIVELYVGKTFSISLGKYENYDVSNYNCIASKSNGNTINVTGNKAGTVKISLYSDNNKWNIETYYITVKDLPTIREVLIVPPSKTRYDVGEKLDLSGLTITAILSDNTIKQISEGYTVKGYNKNKEGYQTITVDYEGFSRSFNVKVGNSSNIVDVEEIEKLPQTGDFFDLVDGLYLIVGVLSIVLIYIVYKSIKYSKKEK